MGQEAHSTIQQQRSADSPRPLQVGEDIQPSLCSSIKNGASVITLPCCLQGGVKFRSCLWVAYGISRGLTPNTLLLQVGHGGSGPQWAPLTLAGGGEIKCWLLSTLTTLSALLTPGRGGGSAHQWTGNNTKLVRDSDTARSAGMWMEGQFPTRPASVSWWGSWAVATSFWQAGNGEAGPCPTRDIRQWGIGAHLLLPEDKG